jgi:hypothetical protein
MKKRFSASGMALVTILVFSVILMFVGISVVALATGNSRYSTKRNNELLTRQAALAGINEMKSVLSEAPDLTPGGPLREYLTEHLAPFATGPSVYNDPLRMEYTKSLPESGCTYHVVITHPASDRVDVLSEGYLTEGSSTGTKPWQKSIAVSFGKPGNEYAAFAMNRNSHNFAFTGTTADHVIKDPAVLACGLMDGSFTARNPATAYKYLIYRPIGSTAADTDPVNKERIQLENASLHEPSRMAAPHPFPEIILETTSGSGFGNGTNQTSSGGGGDQEIKAENVQFISGEGNIEGDCHFINSLNISGEGTTAYFAASSTVHVNTVAVSGTSQNTSNLPRLIFRAGNYYFKDFSVNRGIVQIDASEGHVNIFYYHSLSLKDSEFNKYGDAKDVTVYGVKDDFGIPSSEVRGGTSNVLLSNYDGDIIMNDARFKGSIVSDGFTINNSSLELVPSAPTGSAGPMQLISWEERSKR